MTVTTKHQIVGPNVVQESIPWDIIASPMNPPLSKKNYVYLEASCKQCFFQLQFYDVKIV